MDSPTDKLRNLIKNGMTENAIYEFQYLSNYLNDDFLKEKFIRIGHLLSHNFNLKKWTFHMGMTTNGEWFVFQAKIANSILDILSEIEPKSISLNFTIENKISFSRIRIREDICCWLNRFEEIDVENPIYDFHEERENEFSKIKYLDPIFDITILNESTRPLIINHLGITPIGARFDIKGVPISGKIETAEEYSIQIKKFEFGKDETLKLKDPIYMEPNAPFRFNLQLENYRKIAKVNGNDTVIKIFIEANNKKIESPFIKMGMY